MQPEHAALWQKLEAFDIDEADATFPFSRKLAKNNNWPYSFALKAIEEYKRFLFLCVVLPEGASPSPVIDEVWHLHLTYTHNYWTSLCQQTLGRPIHHTPSKGGKTEKQKHEQWYQDTLVQYERIFTTKPPADVWNTGDNHNIILRQSHRLPVALAVLLTLAGLLAITYTSFATLNPYTLTGPEFLEFLAYYMIAVLMMVLVYLYQKKRSVEQMAAALYPADYSLFEATYYTYGYNRATQAALADAIALGHITVTENHQLQYTPQHTVRQHDHNPLLPALRQFEAGSILYKDELETHVFNRSLFWHPGFERIFKQAGYNVFLWCVGIGSILLMLSRMIQGIYHHKPVLFLVVALIVFLLAFGYTLTRNLHTKLIQQAARRLFEENTEIKGFNVKHTYAYPVANKGLTGLEDTAISLMAISALAFYVPEPLPRQSMFGSDSGGSFGCSGSSDSDGGGSGCGGDGGGGGCGGCGGD